ncbi:MAG: Lipoate-protein ligase A subunit 1 [Methanomassiliicoccales archaeon PtaU1.Bin124]|nr:MAG: Lipoate-protein ligase A subunit 1 [Methanomassiliicoccales archaeon PtaU1.Bin124]
MFKDRWRLIPFHDAPAAENMAIDEAVAEAVSFNEANPTIRFYGWKPSAVSIGCFQSMKDEVDIDACRELGIDRVRRRTGGGAVFHDHDGEITYSVICPERLVEKDITASYKQVCGWAVAALRSLDLDAEFSPINDILVNGKKVSGSAQTRRQGIFTMHGTILYKVDRETMFRVLKVGRTKTSDKPSALPSDRVAGVGEISTIRKEELLLALVGAFIDGKEWYLGELGRDEEARADVIASMRYANNDWNLSR